MRVFPCHSAPMTPLWTLRTNPLDPVDQPSGGLPTLCAHTNWSRGCSIIEHSRRRSSDGLEIRPIVEGRKTGNHSLPTGLADDVVFQCEPDHLRGGAQVELFHQAGPVSGSAAG